MATVSILECSNYEREKVEAVMKQLLDSVGADRLENRKILLKPNILYAEVPEKAVTTHPEVLRAVILYLQKKGNTIFVGDSPAFHNHITAGNKSGLKTVTEECGAVWCDFTKTAVVEVPEGKLVKSFLMADIVKKVDTVFSLAKMKTHMLMYYTGAMKNLFGLIPGLAKSGFHLRFPEVENFAQMIVDLNLAVKAQFAVMDGITAMEGMGPGSGTPRDVGLLMASDNLPAIDIATSSIMTYDPMQIPVLKLALDGAFGIRSIDEIKYPFLKAGDLVIPDYDIITKLKDNSLFKNYMPGFMVKIIQYLTVKRPRFNESCVVCGECIKICPAKALSIKDGKIAINHRLCIKCYCCHEICSKKAIDLKAIIRKRKRRT